MNIIVKNIKWLMLISGVVTCTMFYATIAPEAALMTTFGVTIQGSLAEIVVRNWGLLITLMGGMLIYGAFKPVHRFFILVVVSLSKLVFIGLVLAMGRQYLNKAGTAIAFDSIVVIMFLIYLLNRLTLQEKRTG